MGIGIVGVGHQLPGRVETNEELCALLPDTTPEWIVEKTGIHQRYSSATEDETRVEHGVDAAREALDDGRHRRPRIVGLIIVCTFSGDYIFPPVSAKLQHELGAKGAQIFDLQANCTGFVSGLTARRTACASIRRVRYALVVGVELHSRFVDRTDVDTAIYFSDGAGAVVLGHVADARHPGLRLPRRHAPTTSRCGCAAAAPAIAVGSAAARPSAIDFMEMNGIATWKQAVTHLPGDDPARLREGGLVELADVDLFVFHQANLQPDRVRHAQDAATRRADVHATSREIGNTGAASVGDRAERGRRAGPPASTATVVVLAAVGAGFNFGGQRLALARGGSESRMFATSRHRRSARPRVARPDDHGGRRRAASSS